MPVEKLESYAHTPKNGEGSYYVSFVVNEHRLFLCDDDKMPIPFDWDTANELARLLYPEDEAMIYQEVVESGEIKDTDVFFWRDNEGNRNS